MILGCCRNGNAFSRPGVPLIPFREILIGFPSLQGMPLIRGSLGLTMEVLRCRVASCGVELRIHGGALRRPGLVSFPFQGCLGFQKSLRWGMRVGKVLLLLLLL